MASWLLAAAGLAATALLLVWMFWPQRGAPPEPAFAGASRSIMAMKTAVACPFDRPGTVVLYAIGQSNAANSVQPRTVGQPIHPEVFEYYDGRCYQAASPMLGAEGTDGSLWPMLGAELIARRSARQVVIAVFAVNGAPIRRFIDPNDLLPRWLPGWKQLTGTRAADALIWMQGEADFARKTTTNAYSQAFGEFLSALKLDGVSSPLILVPILTRCADNDHWVADNPTAIAQRTISSKLNGPGAGVDMDRILDFPHARYDGCHLSGDGASAAVRALAHALVTPIRQLQNSGSR